MISIDQLQQGIRTFVNCYLAPNFSGVDRLIVAGACNLFVIRLPHIAQYIHGVSWLDALGIIDSDCSHVDIQAIVTALQPYITEEQISIVLPKIGNYLGVTIKVGAQELKQLMQCINEAKSVETFPD